MQLAEAVRRFQGIPFPRLNSHGLRGVKSSRMAHSTLLLGSSAISRDLPLSSSYVRRLCRRGLLPAVKLGRRWVMDSATYEATQNALAVAYMRRLAEVRTHVPPSVSPASASRQPGDRIPGRGVTDAPRARSYRTSPYKKKKGLGNSQPVDNKGNVGGGVTIPAVTLISLKNQGDGR
jgi:hypothetical protein